MTETEMDALVRGTCVASRSGNLVKLHETRLSSQFDLSPDPVTVAFHADSLDQNPMVVSSRRVVKQFRRAPYRRHDDVNPAVIVQIAESAAAMSGGKRHSGASLSAHVLKSPILAILEDRIRLPVLLTRIQIGILAHMRIGAEQIFVSVIVEVVNAVAPAAHLEGRESHFCLVGVRVEESISFVQIERKHLTAEVSHEKVRLAVVVPVAEISTHA